MKKRLIVAAVLLIVALAVLVIAKVDSSAKAPPAKSPPPAGLPLSAKEFPRTVNISYVDTPFNIQIMVMKERGMLEEAYAPLGITVTWLRITTGAEQAQAMAASSLDIASVINSTTVLLANAAGNPVHIAALTGRPWQTFALMTGPEGPRTVRELKGKTVAGPKGSVLHQMLIAALTKEGMAGGDVSFVHMGLPEARTALLTKRVDAALQAGSLIIRNEEAGMQILLSAKGYITPLLFTAVRPAFENKYPELLDLYLKTQTEAYEWISAHPAEATAIGSRLQEVSAEDGEKLFNWSGIAGVMEESDIAALRDDVEFLFQQNMIERKLDPKEFILPSAFGR